METGKDIVDRLKQEYLNSWKNNGRPPYSFDLTANELQKLREQLWVYGEVHYMEARYVNSFYGVPIVVVEEELL